MEGPSGRGHVTYTSCRNSVGSGLRHDLPLSGYYCLAEQITFHRRHLFHPGSYPAHGMRRTWHVHLFVCLSFRGALAILREIQDDLDVAFQVNTGFLWRREPAISVETAIPEPWRPSDFQNVPQHASGKLDRTATKLHALDSHAFSSIEPRRRANAGPLRASHDANSKAKPARSREGHEGQHRIVCGDDLCSFTLLHGSPSVPARRICRHRVADDELSGIRGQLHEASRKHPGVAKGLADQAGDPFPTADVGR